MKVHFKRLTTIIGLIALSVIGCKITTKDVSGLPPFNHMVGSKFVMQQEMILRRSQSFPDRAFVDNRLWGLKISEDAGKPIAKIHKGMTGRINAVKMRESEGYKAFFIIGKFDGLQATDAEFEILAAGCDANSNELSLIHLPWDDIDAPEYIIIPWDGC